MKNQYVFLIILWLSGQMATAQKQDFTWLSGYAEFSGYPGYGHSMLVFGGDTVTGYATDLHLNFESTIGIGADPEGNVLFYSNGCAVVRMDGSIMPNGSGLNPGAISYQVCPQRGYIVPRGMLVLPGPKHAATYYLIHAGIEYDQERKYRISKIYSSVVNMELEGGNGDLSSKNNELLSGDFESFAAVRHGNGRDWWIIVPDFAGNRYNLFLLNTEGIFGPFEQTIGPSFSCYGPGSVCFSTDGARFARFDGKCQVAVFDFDRCSGELSKPQLILYPNNEHGGGGTAFSPSGKYLYATSQKVLYRADLGADTPILDTIGILNLYTHGTTLGQMQIGPNGKIYIVPMSRANILHSIEHPDEMTNIGFAPNKLKLKGGIGVRTLPNNPNYQLQKLQNSPCDSIISTVEWGILSEKINLTVFPNPANNQISIQVYHSTFNTITIQNSYGKVVASKQMDLLTSFATMDVSNFSSGIYFLLINTDKGLATAKCIFP